MSAHGSHHLYTAWMFVWTVETPGVTDKDQLSNAFNFKGHKVHLSFHISEYGSYCVQLQASTSFPSCETHEMTVRVESRDKTPLRLPNNYGIGPDDKTFWYYKEEEILAAYPDFFQDGGILRFLVYDVDHPKRAGKCTATRLDLTESTDFSNTSPVSGASDVKLMNLDSLSSDLRDLLASGGASSDVQLNCKGIARPVHRAVLAARSQVFSAMFRNKKWRKRDSGAVDVGDLDEDVLDLFLQYLYSGKLPNTPEDKMHELYALAHKYAVHGLKKICSDWMVENMSADNCTTFLLTAEDHSDAELKNALIESIADHFEWLGSTKWRAFSNEHPILAIEVYHKYYGNTKTRTLDCSLDCLYRFHVCNIQSAHN